MQLPCSTPSSSPRKSKAGDNAGLWVRLVNGITTAGTLSSFDIAASRAEGYIQGLVDCEQLSTKYTDRDYLIISTLTEWRAHLAANFQCSTLDSRWLSQAAAPHA
jgi:hypothetical protein